MCQGQAKSSHMLHQRVASRPSSRAGRAGQTPLQKMDKPTKYCPFCDSQQHFFNQCSAIKQLSTEQREEWIKAGKRCWRCGRDYQAAQCYLKACCKKCNRTHLEVLHEVNSSNKAEKAAPAPNQPAMYYLDPARRSNCVLLKMVKVFLHHGKRKLETYAILDDGSERTILLHRAAQELGLEGQKEDLALRTIRQDIRAVPGKSVSFFVSSVSQPRKRYKIRQAFTAVELGLSTHSHPAEALQRTYRHLRGLPLQSFSNAQPLILIGSDYPHLLTPVEAVHLGPLGGPAALKTRLGWTLQGPAKVLMHLLHLMHLHISVPVYQFCITFNRTPRARAQALADGHPALPQWEAHHMVKAWRGSRSNAGGENSQSGSRWRLAICHPPLVEG